MCLLFGIKKKRVIKKMQLIRNLEHDRLELVDEAQPALKPLYVDFAEGKLAKRYQQGIGLREPLARAVGVKKGYCPSVLDATAGLGRDAFILASLGCSVTLLERSPIIAELLADGLRHAKENSLLSDIISRIDLHVVDSLSYLSTLPKEKNPDVIYLDPMYPASQKSDLVKKEMRMVRAVVGDDPDIEALFQLALQHARAKVVVKRHKHAKSIADIKPTHVIESGVVRFDVYMI
jgi:16S rRNA (guanine1516-N2)-methyltransferase